MTTFLKTNDATYLRLDIIDAIKITVSGFYVAITSSGQQYELLPGFNPTTDLHVIPQPEREKKS